MKIGRGEVWIIDLGYFGKVRPCLVLSQAPDDIDRNLRTVVPFTTQPRRTRFEVILEVPFLARGESVVDVQNMMTTAPPKFLKRLGSLSSDQLDEVGRAARTWLGL